MDTHTLWQRYQEWLCDCPEIGLRLDISRMHFADDFFDRMSGPMEEAFSAMEALEKGAIANPDEGRQVGHYWLRAPELAPEVEMTRAIEETLASVEAFAADVHNGIKRAASGKRFTDFLLIGIGGSALGPQWVADALGHPRTDALRAHFFDNSDPDGMDKVLAGLEDRLDTTLVVVISKSGSTPETRNGMLVAKAEWQSKGIDFGSCAVAVTGEGSNLDRIALEENWLARFPMWDWVGGRTSETSAVGLLPAALQGLDIRQMLAGARQCDKLTRNRQIRKNPAALLALMWFHGTNGQGEKDMVLLPYRDRLLLFSRYLQQLIMESLGKNRNLQGESVSQGIAVYGNKGSTDQHAYVQQLREGVDNFFVTFVDVLQDPAVPASRLEVEPSATSSDFLRGFLLGTRRALTEAGRESITLTVDRLDGFRLGALIALYERAVGLYATLVGVNAYHQPGVEAGKKAAAGVLAAQGRLLGALDEADRPMSVSELAAKAAPDDPETIFHLLEGLSANGRIQRSDGAGPLAATYSLSRSPDRLP